MARTICLAVLAACLVLAKCQANNCAGVATGAKYRYQWMYQMNDPSVANKKALDAAVTKWMAEDCKNAIAQGQGPATVTSPASFGLSNHNPDQVFADYGAWSDWASVDDMKACIEKGIKSGNIAKLRTFAKKASRVVIDLSSSRGSSKHSCKAGSLAPAGIRYMYNYIMTPYNNDACKKASMLQDKIVQQDVVVRSGQSCDAIADDTQVYGSTAQNTADFGGFVDFKDADGLTKYFASTDPNVKTARADQRGMSSSSMRIAIAVPSVANAAIAKESGPGRRMQM